MAFFRKAHEMSGPVVDGLCREQIDDSPLFIDSISLTKAIASLPSKATGACGPSAAFAIDFRTCAFGSNHKRFVRIKAFR